MREIKFRGKRVDNGEWVYGDLIHYATEKDGIQYDNIGISNDFEHHEVDPSTVGQYTGLNDKDGKEIWEGDWLRVCVGYVSTVSFEDGGFVSVYKHPEDGETIPLFDAIGKETTVIGNIHENG